nr:30S ribosomal protein S20 [Nocardia cyriacigeorgica]
MPPKSRASGPKKTQKSRRREKKNVPHGHAHIKSQMKRIRTNEEARQRNQSVKSPLRTAIRSLREPARPFPGGPPPLGGAPLSFGGRFGRAPMRPVILDSRCPATAFYHAVPAKL